MNETLMNIFVNVPCAIFWIVVPVVIVSMIVYTWRAPREPEGKQYVPKPKKYIMACDNQPCKDNDKNGFCTASFKDCDKRYHEDGNRK